MLSVYSGDIHRAKTFADRFGAATHFDNYDSFLDSGIDAVYIAGTNSTHYLQAKKALLAGKFVLCEKPITNSAEEAAELHSLALEPGRIFTINYTYRYHPFIIKAKDLLDNHKLGKILNIQADFNVDLVPGSNFRYDKGLAGGGALRDLGTHMIDTYRFLMGEITDISGYLDNLVYKADVEDFATAIVKFENGSYGNFTVSYAAKKSINSLKIIGHKGSLRIDNLIGMRYSSSKLTISLEGEAQKVFRKRANKLYRLLRDVNTSFINKVQPQITSYDGLANLRLMETLERECRK
ncbi:Gfo/Idh/MocA family oxidoreductase [Ignavibacteriales bacterium]